MILRKLLDNDSLICSLRDTIISYYQTKKSVVMNVNIKFYIDNVYFNSFKLSLIMGCIKYKNVSFGSLNFDSLLLLLKNNFHYNQFSVEEIFFKEGKIECHGHGDFWSVDSLIINCFR